MQTVLQASDLNLSFVAVNVNFRISFTAYKGEKEELIFASSSLQAPVSV